MSAMSEPQRTTLAYVGEVPVIIGGHAADASPSTVRPGEVVEVNASVVETLLASDLFRLEGGEAPQLRGEALDDALREAGLPLTGTADEKRQRLAEHHIDPAANDGTDDHGEDNGNG